MHNQLVSLMIENWSICSNDVNDVSIEIKRILGTKSQSIIESGNMNFNEFKSILDSTDLITTLTALNLFDYKQQIDSLGLSSQLTLKLKGLIDILDGIDGSKDVSEIQAIICNYYQQNNSNLSEDDLVLFGAMVDVSIYSTELWLDSELGGLNKYSYFQNILVSMCDDSLQSRWTWGGIIGADATGIVTGAVNAVISSGGAAAVPNPALGGLPTASVIGLVTGAGASVAKAWF